MNTGRMLTWHGPFGCSSCSPLAIQRSAKRNSGRDAGYCSSNRSPRGIARKLPARSAILRHHLLRFLQQVLSCGVYLVPSGRVLGPRVEIRGGGSRGDASLGQLDPADRLSALEVLDAHRRRRLARRGHLAFSQHFGDDQVQDLVMPVAGKVVGLVWALLGGELERLQRL